jgi:hypothetical protein
VLNGWDDWVNERTLPTMIVEPVFTAEEQSAVLVFNDATVMVAIPSETYPPEESVWTSEYWQHFARTAQDALAVFMKRGRLSEDIEIDEPELPD